MANARPTGKLTTGAVGNFLLGAAALIFILTIGVAIFTGGRSAGESAGIMVLVAAVLVIGGGICGSLGWFGLGKLYGGVNTLAGIFSIVMAAVPILVVVLAMGAVSSARNASFDAESARETAQSANVIGIILGLVVPALLGIFGGLGAMSAKTSLAKPAGLVLLIGGIATAALAVFALLEIGVGATVGSIVAYVGFFGLAIGFFLAGATMLSERAES